MSQRIRWRRTVAEGLAITASILLAFMIDAGWDARVERAEEHTVLVGLQEELAENAAALVDGMDGVERYLENLRALIEARPADLESLPDSSVDRVMSTLGGSAAIALQVAQVESIVNSGDLALIRSRELRRQISLWRNTVDQIVGQGNAATVARDEVREIAHDHGVWTSAATHGPVPVGWKSPLSLPAPPLGEALAAARADSRFTERAVALFTFYQVYLRQIKNANSVLTDLLVELSGGIDSA